MTTRFKTNIHGRIEARQFYGQKRLHLCKHDSVKKALLRFNGKKTDNILIDAGVLLAKNDFAKKLIPSDRCAPLNVLHINMESSSGN